MKQSFFAPENICKYIRVRIMRKYSRQNVRTKRRANRRKTRSTERRSKTRRYTKRGGKNASIRRSFVGDALPFGEYKSVNGVRSGFNLKK